LPPGWFGVPEEFRWPEWFGSPEWFGGRKEFGAGTDKLFFVEFIGGCK